MANIYCDLDLTTGLNDGSSWTDAYQSFKEAGDNSSAGDTIWVQGTTDDPAANQTITFPAVSGRPVRVIGVKDGTTNEPPTASDIIPGLLTGDSTRAYAQTGANTPPLIQNSGTSVPWVFNGHFWMYGLRFEADSYLICAFSGQAIPQFWECEFETNGSNPFSTGWGGSCYARLYYCNVETITAGAWNQGQGGWVLEVFDQAFEKTTNNYVIEEASNLGNLSVFCSDFSNVTSLTDVVEPNSSGGGTGKMWGHGIKVGSGDDLMLAPSHPSEFSFSSVTGPDPGTPKGTGGSFQDQEWESYWGSISMETTVVRSGGADDGGDGGYSLALTPTAGRTMESLTGLFTDWICGVVGGDGTAKTLTVYIANSSGADLQDDDVIVEVISPSEDGNIKSVFTHTRLAPLDTPANITDDAVSDWGSGAGSNNAQKFEITITPKYTGIVMVRVGFMKYYAASPATLYVCPKFEIS